MGVLRRLGTAVMYGVIAVIYLGAFSRFTHGAYTPGFYAYQLDRAPDNQATRGIPYADTVVATLALVRATRMHAFAFSTAAQVMGVALRLQEHKNVGLDLVLLAATMAAVGVELSRRIMARHET